MPVILFFATLLMAALVNVAQAEQSSSSAPERAVDKPSVYVFVIDTSTSMQWIFDDVKKIIKDAARRTRSNDSITLILFGDRVSTLASYESMSESKKQALCRLVDDVYAERCIQA